MSSSGVQSVDGFNISVKKLLRRAREIKPAGGIEPALTTQDFGTDLDEVKALSQSPLNRSYAAIETACRNTFYDLLASTSIEEAAFGQVWNLFDALSVLSDLGKSQIPEMRQPRIDNLQSVVNPACFSGS